MKLMHLSDLHLGKRVNEFSMLEDQRYILDEILVMIDAERPDAVIVAGDVYDRGVPNTDAVELFDDFVVKLAERRLQVFVISGNHDSPERLAFGSRLMSASGVHICRAYDGKAEPVTLEDGYGPADIRMLPFVKPANVRRFFPEEDTESYTAALRTAVGHMDLDMTRRNVLVTHQFVTGAERSESETVSVGGADNVDASVFEDFDYVALGHIHGPQNIGDGRLRYCGTPLKYSFSEAKQEKSVTVAELGAKGDLTVRTLPLRLLHDMREIRGTYAELMLRSFYEGTSLRDDYLHITLTDEDDIPDAMNRLRSVYGNLMKLDYDNARTRHSAVISGAVSVEEKTPLELFGELYEQQNGAPMSGDQEEYMKEQIEKIWGGAR